MSSTKRLSRGIGFGIGFAVAGAVLLWFMFGDHGTVVTENAYVKAEKYSLSTDVAGRVVEVLVRPNQRVKRDEVLVRLDDTPYQLAVAEARAHLAQVRNEVLGRRSDYAEVEAELRQAQSDVEYYERKLARNVKMGPVAISESQLDDARQQLLAARSKIAVNRQKLARLKAELGGDPALPLEEQADVRVAQAQLDNALYRLSRTEIRAPVDGVVANEVPQVSEMAAAGLALVSMIGTERVWVEANLKETQLRDVRPGQHATVTVDAYPDRVWEAEVESVSPASGAEFALIPAQNASGNWVKVVQRVPVHLRLDGDDGPPLRAGMSAQVRIDVDGGAGHSASGLSQSSQQPGERLGQVAAGP